jgi:hypothetical protein
MTKWQDLDEYSNKDYVDYDLKAVLVKNLIAYQACVVVSKG